MGERPGARGSRLRDRCEGARLRGVLSRHTTEEALTDGGLYHARFEGDELEDVVQLGAADEPGLAQVDWVVGDAACRHLFTVGARVDGDTFVNRVSALAIDPSTGEPSYVSGVEAVTPVGGYRPHRMSMSPDERFLYVVET
jgi:hypothetical protein